MSLKELPDDVLSYFAKAKSGRRIPREFVEVYRYQVVDGAIKNAKILDESLWRSRGVVYIRVCQKRVLYIGKSDGLLCRRILRHVRSFSGSDQVTFNEYRNCVNGRTVSILAYRPEPLKTLGLEVPTHIGLEWAMIERFKPPFVKRR